MKVSGYRPLLRLYVVFISVSLTLSEQNGVTDATESLIDVTTGGEEKGRKIQTTHFRENDEFVENGTKIEHFSNSMNANATSTQIQNDAGNYSSSSSGEDLYN